MSGLSVSACVYTVLVGGKVVPASGDGVTPDLTSWSVVVLPDQFTRPGKLLHFLAYFISTTPVYLQVWRPGNTSNQLTIVYYTKVYPRELNQIVTVSADRRSQVKRSPFFIAAA